MKKIHIAVTLLLLTAVMLLSGCANQSDASDKDNNTFSDIFESDTFNNSTMSSESPESDKSGDCPIKIDCYVDDEEKFAFNINFDIHEDSIKYIDIDEEIFGVDRFIDDSALRFDILFTVKDEFREKYKYYNKCSYKVFDNRTGIQLALEILQNDEVFRLSDCSIDKIYRINFEQSSDEYGYKAMFVGTLSTMSWRDGFIEAVVNYNILT